MSEPLHIYVKVDKQNNTLEKKDKGIYQLKNRTGQFIVSIKEYDDKL